MNEKNIIKFILVCVILFVSLLFIQFKPTVNTLQVESKKTRSGNTYTLLYKGELFMDVSVKRPDKNDKTILLCIPAAFTDLSNYGVDGLFIDKGVVYNKSK